MDRVLGKFSDQQLAQLLGALNDGSDRMRTRLVVEVSYRLARAGGPAMMEDAESLSEELLNAQFRLREKGREQRRGRCVARRGRVAQPESRKPVKPASVVCIR